MDVCCEMFNGTRILCIFIVVYILFQAFLKVLTMTTELPADPPGHPHFTELILSKFWLVRFLISLYLNALL